MPTSDLGHDEAPEGADDSTLGDVWRRSAERASDARLAGLAAAGLLAVAALCVLALDVVPARVARWWPLLLPAIGGGAFGLWGIAAREEAERRSRGDVSPRTVVALVALRWLAALTAGLALAVALVALLGVALGLVKS